MEELPDLSGLGTRRAPRDGEWVAVDTAPPPKPKRRFKKMLKREVAAAAKAAIAAAMSTQQCSPNSKRQLSKQELQELSRKALEETYQRVKLKKEPRDPTLRWLSRENEEGNVEYKLRLKDVEGGNPYRIQQLITQMKYRLTEGNGECFYYIGVEDDGYPKGLEGPDLQASLSTLHFMAAALGAHVQLVRQMPGAFGRICALARVRRETPNQVAFMDLRVAVSGGVDSGKSSLVAVLSHGSNGAPALDNGRGSARMSVLKHKHELESGRTSSISQQVLGYGPEGEVLNYAGVSSLTPTEISLGAERLLTFIDMGGHERCLKTCLWGMTCMLPDYAVLCICAAGGLGRMSKEHLAVAVALEVPVAVVLTKCDLVDGARLTAVLDQVRALLALALPGLRPDDGQGGDEELEAIAPLIDTHEGARQAAQVLCEMRAAASIAERRRVMVPIFATSAVTGAGLQLLHSFLKDLQPAVQLREQAVQGQEQAVQGPAEAAPDQGQARVQVLDASRGQDNRQDGNAVGGDEQEGGGSGAPRPHQQSVCARPGWVGCEPAQPLQPMLSSSAPSFSAGVGPSLRNCSAQDAPVMFQVDQTFDLHRVGSVVCGTVVQGIIRVGTSLLMGPDEGGSFMPVQVSGMQRMHTPVALVRAGQTAALALMPLQQGVGAGVGLGVDGVGLGVDGVGLQGAQGVGMGLERSHLAAGQKAGQLGAQMVGQQEACELGKEQLPIGSFLAAPQPQDTPQEQLDQQRIGKAKHQDRQQEQQAMQQEEQAMQQEQQEEEEDLFACLGDFEEEQNDGDQDGMGGADPFAAALGAFEDDTCPARRRVKGTGPSAVLGGAVESSQRTGGRNARVSADPFAASFGACKDEQEPNGRHSHSTPDPFAAALGAFGDEQCCSGQEDEEDEVDAALAAFEDDQSCNATSLDSRADVIAAALGAMEVEGGADPIAAALDALHDHPPTAEASAAAAAAVRGAVAAAVAARLHQVMGVSGGVSGDGGVYELVASAESVKSVAVERPAHFERGGDDGDDDNGGFQVHRVTRTSILSSSAGARISSVRRMDVRVSCGQQIHTTRVSAAVVSDATQANVTTVRSLRRCRNGSTTDTTSAAGGRRADRGLALEDRLSNDGQRDPDGGGGLGGSGGSGGSDDWQRMCELATSPPAPSFLPQATSPPGSRKGAVLLDASLLWAPGAGTRWEFEAVVVLLGGRWPARGLLSGRWPPLQDDPHNPAHNPPPQSASCGALCAGGGPTGAPGAGVGCGRCGGIIAGARRFASAGGAAAASPLLPNQHPLPPHPHISDTLPCLPDAGPDAKHGGGGDGGVGTGVGSGVGLRVGTHAVRPCTCGTGAAPGQSRRGVLPTGSAGASDSDTGMAADQQSSPLRSRGRRRKGQSGNGGITSDSTQPNPTPVSSCTSLVNAGVSTASGAGQGLGVGSGSVQPGSVGPAGVGPDASPPRVGRRLTRHSSTGGIGGPGEHIVVLHCGSIRQAAHVVWMQEVQQQEQGAHAAGPDLDAELKYRAIRATAAILHHDPHSAARGLARAGSSSATGSDQGDSPRAGGRRTRDDLGCVVRARFRFLSRPEWVRQGARLIIRDRSDGHIAGAGFVEHLN